MDFVAVVLAVVEGFIVGLIGIVLIVVKMTGWVVVSVDSAVSNDTFIFNVLDFAICSTDSTALQKVVFNLYSLYT